MQTAETPGFFFSLANPAYRQANRGAPRTQFMHNPRCPEPSNLFDDSYTHRNRDSEIINKTYAQSLNFPLVFWTGTEEQEKVAAAILMVYNALIVIMNGPASGIDEENISGLMDVLIRQKAWQRMCHLTRSEYCHMPTWSMNYERGKYLGARRVWSSKWSLWDFMIYPLW